MDMVLFVLVRNEKLIIIEDIFYSTICLELRNQDIFCAVENYEHLEGLSLADNSPCKTKRIEVLIGLNY